MVKVAESMKERVRKEDRHEWWDMEVEQVIQEGGR